MTKFSEIETLHREEVDKVDRSCCREGIDLLRRGPLAGQPPQLLARDKLRIFKKMEGNRRLKPDRSIRAAWDLVACDGKGSGQLHELRRFYYGRVDLCLVVTEPLVKHGQRRAIEGGDLI